MKNEEKEKNLTIRNDTLYHDCGARLLKLKPETVLVNFPAYCTRCKKEIQVNIVNEKIIS